MRAAAGAAEASDSAAAASTAPTGGRAGSPAESAPVVELRWIDPDRWGRFAWTFLFGTTLTLEAAEEAGSAAGAVAMADWHAFVHTLPFALPCQSCKVCCARFLAEAPPPAAGGGAKPEAAPAPPAVVPTAEATPRAGGGLAAEAKQRSPPALPAAPCCGGPVALARWPPFCPGTAPRRGGACPLPLAGAPRAHVDTAGGSLHLDTAGRSGAGGGAAGCGCTAASARAWLARLRRDVRARNLAAGEAQAVANRLQGHHPAAEEEGDAAMAARFTRRAEFRELWLLDAFVFLSAVLLTAEYDTPEGRAHLREFLRLALRLSALPLRLSAPPAAADLTLPAATRWLAASPASPDPPLLAAALALLPVRSRRLRRRSAAA